MCDTTFCDDDSGIGWAWHECDTCGEPDPDQYRDEQILNDMEWEARQ